jgi:hypothetical protein
MRSLIAACLFLSLPVFACDEGIVKENNRQIPVDSIFANDMTREDFEKNMKGFEAFFAPLIERDYDQELIVFHSWGSNTVNAYAEKKPGKVMVTVYGGLARHPAITLDGLSLTLCHELGHHFGGYPKKTTNRWSSAEGQADYYSTTKCLRVLWEKEDNQKIMKDREVPSLVREQCHVSYKTKAEQALCERISLAGQSLALMFQDLDHDSITPKFETPDPLKVHVINYMHPFSQCRLDTYFQGAICPVSEAQPFLNNDEAAGACHPRNGHQRGLRPQCWFVHRN